jgi:hypothetical protein
MDLPASAAKAGQLEFLLSGAVLAPSGRSGQSNHLTRQSLEPYLTGFLPDRSRRPLRLLLRTNV